MYISTLVISFAVCLCTALHQPHLVRVPVISAASIGLTRRQVSIGSPSPVPSECTSTCNTVNDEINLGCPATACCTTTFETQYYNCLECVGTALDATNYSIAQNSLNLLYTTCVDMGYVMPRLELPGQSNSSASATGSGSATALFPTGSSTTTSSATILSWQRALIGTAILLVIAGLL